MDKATLVDSKYNSGEKLLSNLDTTGQKYPIAAWISYPEKYDWTLLLGVPELDKKGIRNIYAMLHKVIIDNGIDLSLNEIQLLDTKAPICVAFRKLIHTGYGISKISFINNFFNGEKFPDSIIYRVN